MNKQDAFEMAVIELLGQEALLEEKISIYKTASMFWNAACEWQKEQTENDIIFHLNEDKDGDFFLTKESFKELFTDGKEDACAR